MARIKMKMATAFVAIALMLTTQAYQGHAVKEHLNKLTDQREKRSINEEEEKPFWANRGKRSITSKVINGDSTDPKAPKYSSDDSYSGLDKSMRHETPFWGNRGRRQSTEVIDQVPLTSRQFSDKTFLEQNLRTKNVCIDEDFLVKNIIIPSDRSMSFSQRSDQEINPFWGNRGRRSEEEVNAFPLWANGISRYNDKLFTAPTVRRDENNPFWGTRGRRDEDPPFWGARGRRDNEDGQESILDLLKNINSELSVKSKRKKTESLWKGRDQNAEVQIFKGKTRINTSKILNTGNDFVGMNSLRQDAIYAEEPYYILVDRSSRSISAEDDPFFISRGKKKVTPAELAKAARDRRGIFEQFAKNTNGDPYFVSRGKKEDPNSKRDQLLKVKYQICSAFNLINSVERNKRDINDRDRKRRNILKKLAAKLQSDPYFVSRGKKSLDLDDEHTTRQMYELCS